MKNNDNDNDNKNTPNCPSLNAIGLVHAYIKGK